MNQIDRREETVRFWDKVALLAKDRNKAFAGMLMEGREFQARDRSKAEQEHFLKIVQLSDSSRVLEVGAGGGRWGFFLANKIASYIGLDISEQMVCIANEEVENLNLSNLQFQCKSILDFEPNTKFDLVYFSGVLMYMDDSEALLSIIKASSLLARGGLIISRDSIQKNYRIEKTGNYPVIYRTEDEYKMLFEKSGFIVDYSELSYKQKRFTGIASFFANRFSLNYELAYALRELLCRINSILGNPDYLKSKKLKEELKQHNKQEHKFFKFIKIDDK